MFSAAAGEAVGLPAADSASVPLALFVNLTGERVGVSVAVVASLATREAVGALVSAGVLAVAGETVGVADAGVLATGEPVATGDEVGGSGSTDLRAGEFMVKYMKFPSDLTCQKRRRQ